MELGIKMKAQSHVKDRKRSEAIAGYVFASPAILGLAVFTILPMVISFFFSFTNWTAIGDWQWVGLDNYIDIFTNNQFFRKSVFVTFYYAFTSTFFSIIAALFVAMMMNIKIKGQTVFRVILYLPVVVPAVASNILWLWLYNPDFGLLNMVLDFFHLPTSSWIFDEQTAVPSLILMSVWACGGTALIFLAGLQDVSQQLLEAVEMDGGNTWHKFRYVTIPTLTPIIFFNLVMGLISAFQSFTQAYIMTEGGPNNSTLFYSLLIYRKAFAESQMGYACALAWILFLIIGLFTLVIFKTSGKWVVYGGGDKG